MPEIPFYAGDGTGPEMVDVDHIAEFPRDAGGKCAYCHADPCAEVAGPETLIGAYMERNRGKSWSRFGLECPMCDGKPT